MLLASLTFAADNVSCERNLAAGERVTDPTACKDDCSDLTKNQTDCVIRKYCNKEIAKALKKQQSAEKRVRALEDELLAERSKKKKKAEANRNSISLIGGATNTKIEISPVPNLPIAEVKNKHELDLGVMYQRDLSDELRLSIQGTLRESVYLGVGYNF